MNVYLPNLRLPSAYQEVEYIQSSWTQYINTGFIPSNTSKIEISMWGWSQYSEFSDLFWARSTWSADASTWKWFHLWYHQISTTTYYWMFWREYNYASGLYANTLSFANWSNHIIEMSSAWIYEDWTSKFTYTNYTFTSPVNWTIFALNDNWTVNSHSAYKLYYCKIWDNWTLVRDFVPCYRKQDSVIWLYDLVNDTFYTNSWTGTFSKGNDVITMSELKNAYIGEVWTPWSDTLLYLPLKNDTNDYSNNHYTITSSWTISKGNIWYQFGSGWRSYLSTPSLTLDWKLSDLTISFWHYYVSTEQTWGSSIIVSKYIGSNTSPRVVFNTAYYRTNSVMDKSLTYMIWNTSNQLKQIKANTLSSWWWHNIICTLSQWTMKIYVDWLLDNTLTWAWTPKAVNTPIYIWAYQGSNDKYFVWELSEVIIDNLEWSASDISKYYNWTKWDYWIS